MAHPVPPQKPSVWTWLAQYGVYLAAAIALAVVWFVMAPEPDIHGERSLGGPLWISAFILAGVAIYYVARRKGAR